MDFDDEKTVYKRSTKGKKITAKTQSIYQKLDIGGKSLDISKRMIIGRDEDADISFPKEA